MWQFSLECVHFTSEFILHISNALYKDQTTTLGTQCPTLYDECVGFLTSPANNVKMQETGPTVYRP